MKIMVVIDANGTPLDVLLSSATPNEVKLIEDMLIEDMLNQVRVPRMGRGRPRAHIDRLIYDKAADSDALRLRLKSEASA